ncbi:MAG: hypothetical protein LQ352_000571 [Teloschistes flavicans]|nr:MAG: hypothetical protein LQ352_000571 [Teloschistes flavicans]
MASEASPRPRSATPSAIPQKRPLNLDDEQHVPAVSSPLNPDAASFRARKPPAREQREKKESLKKREAKGTDTTRSSTPDTQTSTKKSKKVEKALPDVIRPIKYLTKPPKPPDYDPPPAPTFNAVLFRGNRQFNECYEHIFNKKSFRYTNCIADPAFPSSHWFRQTEAHPFGPRFSFQEASSHILFDDTGRCITTEKAFRMARANIGAREGRWYYECKILSGVKSPNQDPALTAGSESGGHVRLGWARREASLDTPVGFDAYSYGFRDVSGQKVHLSRPKDFMPNNESFCEGDVIGLEITLPSLALHRKIVEGSYNKAVDVSDDLDPQYAAAEAPDIVRDRVPIRYKGVVYFEQFEYTTAKELEEHMNPSPTASALSTSLNTNVASTAPPNPNHPSPTMRTLPFSSIKVYKNGKFIGTPFTDLFAFLPPASKPAVQQGARDLPLDDGMLGYFPAISVFRGGAAEVNFGPEFWCPPSDLAVGGDNGEEDDDEDSEDMKSNGRDAATKQQHSYGKSSRLRGMGERYVEQIAEDVVYDLVDETDHWLNELSGAAENAGGNGGAAQKGRSASTAAGMDAGGGMMDVQQGMLGGGGGEIKEIVQEEE